MLMSVIVLPVSAVEVTLPETINDDELYELLMDGFDLWSFTYMYPFTGEEKRDGDETIVFDGPDGKIKYFSYSGELRYYDDYVAKLKTVFTDGVVGLMLDYNAETDEEISYKYHPVIIERNGLLYACELSVPQWNKPVFKADKENVDGVEYIIDVDTRRDFKEVSRTENTVTYSFQVYDYIINFPHDPDSELTLLDAVHNLTVVFEYTSDGWRISGGKMIDTYFYDPHDYNYYLNGAPQTGISTALLAVVALVSGAYAVKRKRR